jgi:hypothetical protein
MAERLAAGNVALALLANTLATGAILVALIFTSNWAPLPFVIGPVLPERYTIIHLKDLPEATN